MPVQNGTEREIGSPKVGGALRFAAWYGIVVGALMMVQWTAFLATGEVPEVQTEPIRLGFHLAAEFVTAAGLVLSGVLLLQARSWGRALYPVAAGMVIYSEIVSPGYFAQKGQWAFVAMFMVILVLAVASVAALVRNERGSQGPVDERQGG